MEIRYFVINISELIILSCFQKGPLRLSYRIFEYCELSSKRMKLDCSTSVSAVTVTSAKEEDEVTAKMEPMDVDIMKTLVESKHEMLQNTEEVKNIVSKEENNNNNGTDSWKEVQIQISENGVMSVTDITVPPVIENNNNTVMTNCIPMSDEGSKISLILRGNEAKIDVSEGVQKQSKHTMSSKEFEHCKYNVSEEISRIPVTVSSAVTTLSTTSIHISPAVAGTTVTAPLLSKTLGECKKHECVKTSSTDSVARSSALETAITKNPTDADYPAKQSDVLLPIPITSAPSSPHLASPPVSSSGVISGVASSQQRNELTALNKKPSNSSNKNIKPSCLLPETQVSGVPSHLKHPQITQSQPLALKVGQISSCSSGKEVSKANDDVATFSKRDTPKMAVVAPTQSMTTNSASSRKPMNSSSSSSSVGYKTLKTPPKSWNQSITRLSFLSSTKNNTYMTNTSGVSCDGRKSGDLAGKGVDSSGAVSSGSKAVGCGNSTVPAKPNRFFKMRNVPRYLGNPSSGVKPMYQVASLNKQELVTQTSLQTSAAKPMYHSTLPPHSSAGNLKTLYHISGSGGSNKLESASPIHTCSKPVTTGCHVGNQQGNKVDSSVPLPVVSPSSGDKQVSQPGTNPQQVNKLDCRICTQSVTQTTTDIKPVSSSILGSGQQHCNKIEDSGTSVHITLASSSVKSMPSMCSAHSGGPYVSNASSSGKSRGGSNNKQESGVPLISGIKSTHQIGSLMPNKQDSVTPPVSKHGGVTLMKIDPKTLSPIVGATSSPGTPPLPLSPSPQSSNPPPSSMTPQNLKTHTPQFPLPAHSNSNRSSASPNPLGSPFLPSLLYSSFPFPNMGVGVGGNRMGTGPPPLVRAGSGMGLGAYHPLPPSINMLFNPHHRSHTHNSTTPGSQSGVPLPAVQRVPASNPQHKSNSSTNNSFSSNSSISAPGSSKSPTNNATGQVSSQNVTHQRTPPPTSHSPSASHQLKLLTSQSLSNQNSTTTQVQSLQAATVTETSQEKATEGNPQQKTVADGSAIPVARTVNGEQSSREVLGKKSDNGTVNESRAEGGDKNNREQGSSSSSSKASSCSGGGSVAEQVNTSITNSCSKSKTFTEGSESEKKGCAGKMDVPDVTQNQTKLKLDTRETGSEGAVEMKKQLEKT